LREQRGGRKGVSTCDPEAERGLQKGVSTCDMQYDGD